MKNRRGLLQLEGLTERIVPAVSIRAVDGDLLIRGTPNTNASIQKQALFINVTADNTVQIRDGGVDGATGTNRGTYFVDGDLILNLSNRNDNVIISLSGGNLSGNIVANLLNGNDSVMISSSGAARTVGAVTVDGGNGTDSLVVFNGNAGDFRVDGGISFNGGTGLDTATLNNDTNSNGNLLIGNGVTLTRVNTVTMGVTDAVSISGNCTINASTDKLIKTTITLGGGASNVSMAGTLNITGTEADDSVTLQNVAMVNTVPTSEDEDLVYEISINLNRSGTSLTSAGNILDINDVQFGDSNSKADFAYIGGKGKDSIKITGETNFTGTARFTLGDGDNVFDVTDGAGDVVFEGDITITGGASGDDLNFDQSVVSGLLTATLGRGTNSLDSGGTIAGGLSYVGGSGSDDVSLTNCENLAGSVSISLGGGTTDCLFSKTNGVTKMDSFTVDLGSSSGTINYASELESLIVFLNPGVVVTNPDPALN